MHLRSGLVFGVCLALLTGCVPVRGPLTPTAVPSPASVLATGTPATGRPVSGTPTAHSDNITLTYWEEDLDEAGVVLDELSARFMAQNPGITVKRTHYTYEDLRTSFREMTRGNMEGEPPDLVRGPGEYAGPFSELGLIQAVDGLYSPDFLGQYLSGALDGATVGKKVWGLPDNFGDHLMLFYNRALVQQVPGDTDAWIAQLKGLTDPAKEQYGLAFAANESYWLVPWLAGFGGWPMDSNDRPALDTAEMVEALWFIHDLKFADMVMPNATSYEESFRLFGQGKAAYVIDGRWNMDEYQGLGIDVGIAGLPRVSQTSLVPASMATGQYWYLASKLEGPKRDAAMRFAEYMTSAEAQSAWLTKLRRLPSSREVANGSLIAQDPMLSAMMGPLKAARGVPPALEMACAWRGMDSQLPDVIKGNLSPDKAAPAMQEVADACMAEIALDPTPTTTATP